MGQFLCAEIVKQTTRVTGQDAGQEGRRRLQQITHVRGQDRDVPEFPLQRVDQGEGGFAKLSELLLAFRNNNNGLAQGSSNEKPEKGRWR